MRIALQGLSALMLSPSALLASASLAPAAVSQSTQADSWTTRAGGLERAHRAIEQCLTDVDKIPRQNRYSCVHAAYQACEDEHGTSQRDLNTCSALSYEAWNNRIAGIMTRFASAEGSKTRLGLRTEEAKREFVESQRRWRAWSAADCELQAKVTEGGSIRPYWISICLSDHAAMRAIELQAIIDWWLG